MAMTVLWAGMAAAAVLCALATGRMPQVSAAAVEGAGAAVELALSMAGMLCLWMGVMEVMRRAGLAEKLSRLLRPALRRLYPAFAGDRAVMDSIAANVSANLLGLGNAATPLGIQAAKRLSRGQNGTLQQVLGALEGDTSTRSVEDIVFNVALGLLDADVSLRRDGYPLPIGPGTWVDLFRPAYDGEPDVLALPDYEPIYGEGDYWERWSVEGFFALRYYSAGEDRWWANTIDVTRGDLYTPRGIRVGDSRAEVLQAYPGALTGDYWGQYPEEPDLLAYVAWSPHVPGEISDLSQLEFYEGLGPAILFFFEGDTLRQITLTDMFN